MKLSVYLHEINCFEKGKTSCLVCVNYFPATFKIPKIWEKSPKVLNLKKFNFFFAQAASTGDNFRGSWFTFIK